MRRALAALGRGAELVGAALFAVMFGTFLLQIVMRYVVRQPLGWTIELCMVCFIWIVFWSSAFMLRERDHVSFNLLYNGAAPPVRRVLAALSAGVLAVALLAALPATADYVAFMRRYGTPTLDIPFAYVYSVFPVFMAAVALREAVRLVRLFRAGWERQL
ncbi:MAG TPA: TRAP transporter small permease [Geminicoccaceae bacterium]|nr:TRAP transporter small permease [Geminicoccaceae bacterium]